MPLSTQADLEKHLQIDFGNDPDDVITLLLSYAQAVIETFCDRTFEAQSSVIETLDGHGDQVLFLSQWPVTAVASLTEDGDALTVDTDFYWYSDGRLVRGDPTAIDRLYWSRASQNVVVTYNHGYATIPKDLDLVSTRLTGRMFQSSAAFANAPIGATGVRSISLEGSDSVEFNEMVADVARGVDDLLPLDRKLLLPWKRALL